MNVRITAPTIELTEEMKMYIQKKVDMLEKYLGSIKATNCDFEVARSVGGQNSGEIYRAEISLNLPGGLLRVEKTEADVYKAIDKVKDHMARSIKKYREKKLGIK